jgi:hypothetical protein
MLNGSARKTRLTQDEEADAEHDAQHRRDRFEGPHHQKLPG